MIMEYPLKSMLIPIVKAVKCGTRATQIVNTSYIAKQEVYHQIQEPVVNFVCYLQYGYVAVKVKIK